MGTRIIQLDFVNGATGYGSEYDNNTEPPVIYRYSGNPFTGLIEHRTLDATVEIYPNPAAARARFTVELPKSEPVAVLLHNAQGQLLRRLDFNGERTLEGSVELTHLPPGVYTVTITSPTGKLTRQLVKN